MKKAITILAVCSLLLTACGQIDDTESKVETTTAIASESTAGEDTVQTSSAKEEKDTSEATTTTRKSSQTASSSSKPTGTIVTTTKKSISSGASGNSVQGQNNVAQNNNGQENNVQPEQNNQQPDNSPYDNNQNNNSAEQNNRPSENKPQNNNPSPPVTTAKPAVTNPPTTTTPKPQTTMPQTEPPEDIIEDTTSLQSVLNYVNSLGRTTDEYYNIGVGLGHDGSDYGKAEAVYNWIRGNVSGNCQVFSAATMYACKGVGLECRYAFFSPDDWYGHMANLVCVEGTWYVFDTQGGRFLKSDKYGEITRIFDENDNTIEISISESAY